MAHRCLWVAVILAGCTASQAEREACYAKNEATAAERAARECAGSWEACPSRPVILDELKASHARCP